MFNRVPGVINGIATGLIMKILLCRISVILIFCGWKTNIAFKLPNVYVVYIHNVFIYRSLLISILIKRVTCNVIALHTSLLRGLAKLFFFGRQLRQLVIPKE